MRLQFWLVLCVCAFTHAQRQEARPLTTTPTESPTIFYIPIRFRTLSPATSQPTTSPTVDSLNFPVYEAPQEVSRVSCQELQWSVTPTGVCLGTSDDCSLRLGWEASRDVCSSMGARLCTATELSLFDAKQGCTIDNLRVWTSTRCLPASARVHLNGDGDEEYSTEEIRTFLTAGYAVSQAASSDYLGITKAMCERDARQQNVRCCADAQDQKNLLVLPLNQTNSQSICSQLGWEPVLERAFCRQPCNQNRCLATNTDNDNNHNCTPSSLSSAIEQCTFMGARLCSVNEVDSVSECLLTKQIWTRTSCANQSVYVVGAQGIDCVPISRRYHVQCCAETQSNTNGVVSSNNNVGKSSNTCSQLGWAGVSANSCANDRVVESACRPNVDFMLARRICTDTGTRLCLPNEIRTAIPLLSGCLSNGFVWTSQPGCEFSFSMAIGPITSSNNNSTICLQQQALNAGVICCADGTPRPPTFMPTSFPTLRPTYSPTKLPSTLTPSAFPTHMKTTPPSRRPRLEVAPVSPAPTSPTISLAPTSPPTWGVCDRNSWPAIKGMKGVCILTKPSVCRPPGDWWSAVSYCEEIGARLCTTAELTTYKKDKTRRGCGSTRVWALDACVKSGNTSASVDMDWPEVAARKETKLKQLKTTKDPNKEHCDIKTASLQVACCALTSPSLLVTAPVRVPNLVLEAVMNELRLPVARSGQACRQLGWNVSKALPHVCAASKVFAPSLLTSSLQNSAPTTNITTTIVVNGSQILAVSLNLPVTKPVAKEKLDCSPSLSFTEASRICANLHARLCTSWELAQGVGQSTGCQLDAVRVWTQTPCSLPNNNSVTSNGTSAVLTQGGAGLVAVDLLCKSTSQDVFPVRCCADS